jgi:peptidyl-prolyl cis-trans isomerase B (cyclophilin B)
MRKLYPFLLGFSFILLTACGNSPEQEIGKVYQDSPPADTSVTTPPAVNQYSNQENQTTAPATETTNPTNTMSKFDQTTMPEKGEQIVVMETSLGTIKMKLFPTKAPKTVENFIGLIDKGYYNGLIFHRVIPGFMIQGGDPTGTGMGGASLWRGKFKDEINSDLSYLKGALAMANSGPNTNGSQFFIVQTDDGDSILERKYSIFGQAFEGLDIVDKIANVQRDGNDKPLEKVVMKKVALEKY